MRAKVVTAFVPLDGMRHFTPDKYHAYAKRMENVIPQNFRAFRDYPLEECWVWEYLKTRGIFDSILPASAVAEDRYPTPHHMVLSNIVQHSRTQWMHMAAEEDSKADVLIWLDYAILKQGAFTGKPVTEEHIAAFVERVEKYFTDGGKDIPFPGIWEHGPISDTGANWRFAGSTHIIPRWHLSFADVFYHHECRKFIDRTGTIPLDLPIWAHTELNSGLPFRWYQANHDATQLTNFPEYRK